MSSMDFDLSLPSVSSILQSIKDAGALNAELVLE